MTIKTNVGKLKSIDELTDEAVDTIVEFLEDNQYEDWALPMGNAYRDNNHYPNLYENEEYSLNEELGRLDPYELLRMGADDWCESADYFRYDGYDLSTTDDVWEDVDLEDFARDILDGDYFRHLPDALQEIVDEYEEAKEKIENYNEGRAMAEEVIAKFTNCEADVTDLLQCLDKLVRNDDYWSEEE